MKIFTASRQLIRATLNKVIDEIPRLTKTLYSGYMHIFYSSTMIFCGNRLHWMCTRGLWWKNAIYIWCVRAREWTGCSTRKHYICFSLVWLCLLKIPKLAVTLRVIEHSTYMLLFLSFSACLSVCLSFYGYEFHKILVFCRKL